jgi:hypothetical protein
MKLSRDAVLRLPDRQEVRGPCLYGMTKPSVILRLFSASVPFFSTLLE